MISVVNRRSIIAVPIRPALLLVVFVLALLSGCGAKSPTTERLAGAIFGTSWSLTYLVPAEGVDGALVEKTLADKFALVNRSMSTYDPNSLISRFNRMPAVEAVEVDPDFAYVLATALDIGRHTDGAYDVTVPPLLALWGFGPDGPSDIPSDADIATVRVFVGPQNLIWDAEFRLLAKRQQDVELDFSSIAKGYAVDIGADALLDLGIESFMFEIGGEVRLHGNSPRGDDWRIAIERPDSSGRQAQAAIVGTGIAIATSGDYRNFFEQQGERYSHLIDPRTGRPIKHELVSVTVIDPSTTIADAWATALIVLGVEQGMAIAQSRGLAAYFIRREGDLLSIAMTEAFKPYLSSQE